MLPGDPGPPGDPESDKDPAAIDVSGATRTRLPRGDPRGGWGDPGGGQGRPSGRLEGPSGRLGGPSRRPGDPRGSWWMGLLPCCFQNVPSASQTSTEDARLCRSSPPPESPAPLSGRMMGEAFQRQRQPCGWQGPLHGRGCFPRVGMEGGEGASSWGTQGCLGVGGSVHLLQERTWTCGSFGPKAAWMPLWITPRPGAATPRSS